MSTTLLLSLLLSQTAIPAPASATAIALDPLHQGGFEVPDQGTGFFAYHYTPSGSAWTFTGGTGLAGNGSGFTQLNPPAPQGDQVLFVQGGNGSTVSQSFSVTGGRYRLT